MAHPVTSKQWQQSGWLHALFVAILAYPLGNLASRLGVAELEAHPVAYAAVSMLAAAVGLMLGARPGPLGTETLARPETWLYGVLNTTAFTLAVSVAVFVSATQMSLLTCVPIVLVYALSVLFLGHRVLPLEWFGLGLILLAVIFLLGQLPLPSADIINLSLLLLGLGLAQALQKIVAERHKTNRAAVTFAQNMRVTAIVMGVTSSLFIAIFLGLAYLKSLSPEALGESVPTLTDFINWPMFVLAVVIGLSLRAPSKFCEFIATKKISAKYFLAVTAVQPCFTALYEWILDASGIAPMIPLTGTDLTAMAMIVLGSLTLALAGWRADQQRQISKPDFSLDPQLSRTVIQTAKLTLQFTKHNHAEAAKLLGLTTSALQTITATPATELQVTPALAKKLQQKFAHNVAMADPLTGLANRLQCLNTINERLRQRKIIYIALIDLNQFKPINDKFGHAAGDAILQAVAKRLKENVPRGALVARLGGDEFVVASHTQLLPKNLKKAIAQPYLTAWGTLSVSAAIGLAQSPQQGKAAAALIAAADHNMYRQKKNRDR